MSLSQHSDLVPVTPGQAACDLTDKRSDAPSSRPVRQRVAVDEKLSQDAGRERILAKRSSETLMAIRGNRDMRCLIRHKPHHGRGGYRPDRDLVVGWPSAGRTMLIGRAECSRPRPALGISLFGRNLPNTRAKAPGPRCSETGPYSTSVAKGLPPMHPPDPDCWTTPDACLIPYRSAAARGAQPVGDRNS
jgi:hypothetical protein